jgi:hypothetical protein
MIIHVDIAHLNISRVGLLFENISHTQGQMLSALTEVISELK